VTGQEWVRVQKQVVEGNDPHGGLWPPCRSSQTFSRMIPQHFSNLVHSTHTYLPMKVEQCVPKCRHINFRRRGITQKKGYNIQNKAKVWN